MRLEKFELTPVEQQGFAMDDINKRLQGSVLVETYTKPNSLCGDDRDLVIFAFYPDAKNKEADNAT